MFKLWCIFVYFLSVPEYDVALPFEANEKGSFVTYSLNHQSKRSLAEDENNNATPYRYIINTLGEKLDLRVKRNSKFMAPGLHLETRGTAGQRITKPVSRESFVIGKVASDPDSMVALSVTGGLVGLSLTLLIIYVQVVSVSKELPNVFHKPMKSTRGFACESSLSGFYVF